MTNKTADAGKLACDLFQLDKEAVAASEDLFHRKHNAALSRAHEILTYKPATTTDVEEALNTWAWHMTKKDAEK